MRVAPLVIALSLTACATMKTENGFLNRTLTVGGKSYPYVVYVPRDFDRSGRWPVILFLHGAGERGADGLKPTQVGMGTAIRFNSERIPALVVFPQAPDETRWLGEPAGAAMAALDRSIAEFNGDPARVYLTGLSMGGYGTWYLATAHPERFSALVVICGGIVAQPTASSVRRSPLTENAADPYAFTANAVRATPVWIFHGAVDPVIPVTESRRMYDALKKAGADVRYSELPGIGHNAWDAAYGNPDLWLWLFGQHR